MNLNNKKILLIKLRYIGDTLSILPVVENLKQNAPGVVIDVMVHKGTEDILRFHPDIRKIWLYDREKAIKNVIITIAYYINLIKNIRYENYDAVIDFTLGDRAAVIAFLTGASLMITYNDSSRLSHILMNHVIHSDPKACHIVDRQLASLSALGIDAYKREMTIHIPEHIGKDIDRLLKDADLFNDSLRVTIHPGARGALRRWRPERFAEIAVRLKEKFSANILLVGGPGEEDIVDNVEKEMKFPADLKTTGLSLLQMAALFKKCVLFLGNDSAPGHIGAGVGCPTLSLFGPTFPHMWRPIGPESEVIFKDFPCCGCRQCLCEFPDNSCMDGITVDEVWERVERLVNRILK